LDFLLFLYPIPGRALCTAWRKLFNEWSFPMNNLSIIDISVFLLVIALSVILSLYNRRQAVAIEEISQLGEDMIAMQIRDRRAKREGSVTDLDPLAWLAGQVQAVANKRIEPVSVHPILAVKAAEIKLRDGGKVLVSPLSKTEIQRYDRFQKKGNSRLDTFAARPILVGRYTVANRTLLDNEFLDIEAAAVGQHLGLEWRNPVRLWVYVF
jgi:hypothetical protein